MDTENHREACSIYIFFIHFCSYTDADIGYGPAVQNRDEDSTVGGAKGKGGGTKGGQSGFHPQAPPITVTDGPTQAGDSVVNFDSNFIMMKKSDTLEQVKQV